MRDDQLTAAASANAHITISALDSPSSESGILHTDRGVPEVWLSPDFTLRKQLRPLKKVLTQCPLNTRGWCLQEKFLSRALLHFSREQIFWECRHCSDAESDPTASKIKLHEHHARPTVTYTRPFMGLEGVGSSIPTIPGSDGGEDADALWKLWRSTVEQFSKRDLTFGTDKFPALAGVATRLKQLARDRGTVGSTTYLAGLWREDLARGLCWGPAWDHLGIGNRKAGGFDKCEVLRTSSVEGGVAPSWSWASVDGWVTFFGHAGSEDATARGFEIVDVDMSAGYDDLMAQRPVGKLIVRGWLAKVWWRPYGYGKSYYSVGVENGYNVGSLAVGRDDENGFIGAMLDMGAEEQPRASWALLAWNGGGGGYTNFLILDQVKKAEGAGGGQEFVRIGFCNDQNGSLKFEDVQEAFEQVEVMLA